MDKITDSGKKITGIPVPTGLPALSGDRLFQVLPGGRPSRVLPDARPYRVLPGGNPHRIPLFIAAIVLLIATLLSSSCTKPTQEDDNTAEPPTVIIEKKEDLSEAFYAILNSENKHTSNLSLDKLREFYSGGSIAPLISKLAASQSTAEMNLSATVDRAVFESETRNAESPDAGNPNADFIAKLLRDASVSIKCSGDPSSRDSMTNIALVLSGRKLVSADLHITAGERFALRSEELYPNYVAIDYSDLMKIISDATHNETLGQLPYDSLFAISGKISKLFAIANVKRDQTAQIKKPFIDKMKDTAAKENFTIEEGVSIAAAPDKKFKKVSVSLASDDLRQMLTVMAQAAKENTALAELIKEKYTIFYDFIGEMADLGLNFEQFLNSLAPVESIDGMFQSSFAAFEAMLGSAEGLPIKAVKLDLFVDGAVLNCVNISAWTKIANAPGTGDSALPEAAQPDSVWIVENSGEPAIFVSLSSIDGGDKIRRDSLVAEIADAGGGKNKIKLTSELGAAKNGGESKLEAVFDGPAFMNDFPNFIFKFTRDGAVKSIFIQTDLREADGGLFPLMRFNGELKESGNGNSYEFGAELALNDINVPGSGSVSNAVDALSASKAVNALSASATPWQAGGSDYAVVVKCDGTLAFGRAVIPYIDEEGMLLLDQDSFYNGVFESVAKAFQNNLILFVSANRQFLSSYGAPGF